MEIVNKPTRIRRNGKANGSQSRQHASDRMEKQARKVIRDVREMGSTVRDIAQEKLEDVRESASEYKDQGQEKIDKVERSIEQYIVEHPVKTVLIAAGAGLVLGRLWMRR